MRTTKAQQGQTFFDSVIENTGDIINAFDMALANNISMTDVLFNQMDLIVVGKERKEITKLFTVHKPSSSDKDSYIVYNYTFLQTLPSII